MLKDGGRQPSNREERSLSASTVIARWQGNGEPCKSRRLRTVLWAAGGEIPPADPAAWNPHYRLRLADLPWQGRTVELRVRVRRFRCATITCPRRIFAEQFSAVAVIVAGNKLRVNH
jgi:hypothetical protein